MKLIKRLFLLLLIIFSFTLFACTIVFNNEPVNGEVEVKLTKIEISNKLDKIKVGEEFTLSVKFAPLDASNKNVIFTSSDPSVASINDTGKVSALKEGVVTIAATSVSDNTIKDSFTLTVESGAEKYDSIKDLKDKDNAKVSGVVCGINKESFFIDDGTGLILVYLGNTWECDLVVGDVSIVEGTISTYGNALQFGKSTKYTKYANTEYIYENPKALDGVSLDSYLKLSKIDPKYVSVSGELSQNGSYFNLKVDGANALVSLSYPKTPSELSNYVGKDIVVTGFITGATSSKYVNILFTNIKLKESEYLSFSEYEAKYYEYIYSVLGNDVVIYSNDDINPFGIDLDIYGDDIYAVFCDYDIDSAIEPYTNIDRDAFYNDYEEASSYIDSYFRSCHGLMSGDITPQGHIPNKLNITENGRFIKCSQAFYVLTTTGDYIGYLPNDFSGNFQMIWYGGAYISLNEVSAYLLAFGEVPINSNYDKSSGKGACISDFGIYGRVNKDVMNYDSSKWPYEPELPGILLFEYTETDFGTIGGYTSENSTTGTKYNQKLYNTGSTINRGAARLCFISDSRITKIEERRVFYTYNHYNDFEEYLNYNNGFGVRFGNETAGNEYCGSASDYNKSAKWPPTQYEYVLIYGVNEILK